MSRVAVIGAGAVGCYYGARLAEAGHEVHFLLRRDYDAVASGGMHIDSHLGDLYLERPLIARQSGQIGAVDWVICALKATALDRARALLAPCIGEQTRLLALMNGLGIEEEFSRWFPRTPIFGGLAFTCINRGAPGRIHHLDYGPIILGHLGDDPTELEEAHALWKNAIVEVSLAPSLLKARWYKLCWNVPFNGLTVTAGGVTTDLVIGDPHLRAAVRGLIEELVLAANADLRKHQQGRALDPDEVAASMIGRTETMLAYRPSTMIDFVEGREMELEAIFDAPLERARELAIETPLLEMLSGQLRLLNAGPERDRNSGGAPLESAGGVP